jgi:dynein heavy chain
MKAINKIRDENKDVGLRVSRLFFVLISLALVDPMYQYSLDFFKRIFEDAVRAEEDAGIEKGSKNERRAFWIKEFTRRLYNNVSRSLFQKDNLLFSFLLCLQIMDERYLPEGYAKAEVRFLMAGSTQVELTKPNPSGADGWLLNTSWLNMLEMSSKFEIFKVFDDEFA